MWGGVRAAIGDYSSVGYVALSAACIAVGLVIAAVNKRLVRWLVPLMHPACPSCGYALGKTHSLSCSECGFVLEHNNDKAQNPSEEQAS